MTERNKHRHVWSVNGTIQPAYRVTVIDSFFYVAALTQYNKAGSVTDWPRLLLRRKRSLVGPTPFHEPQKTTDESGIFGFTGKGYWVTGICYFGGVLWFFGTPQASAFLHLTKKKRREKDAVNQCMEFGLLSYRVQSTSCLRCHACCIVVKRNIWCVFFKAGGRLVHVEREPDFWTLHQIRLEAISTFYFIKLFFYCFSYLITGPYVCVCACVCVKMVSTDKILRFTNTLLLCIFFVLFLSSVFSHFFLPLM